jgi:hypothetical protein
MQFMIALTIWDLQPPSAGAVAARSSHGLPRVIATCEWTENRRKSQYLP